MIRPPARSLTLPSEEDVRRETIEEGTKALEGVRSVEPWELVFPKDQKDFAQRFSGRDLTSQNAFRLAAYAVYSYLFLGAADDEIDLRVTERLIDFETKLFNHLEGQTRPFVSKLRPRGRKR